MKFKNEIEIILIGILVILIGGCVEEINETSNNTTQKINETSNNTTQQINETHNNTTKQINVECKPDIIVYVKDIDESFVSGASVVLYNSSWGIADTKNTSPGGYVNFSDPDNGTYYMEIYAPATDAYWGSSYMVSIESCEDKNITINRTTPYIGFVEVIDFYGNNRTTFALGEEVKINIVVRNPENYWSAPCKIELHTDKNKAYPWDYNETSINFNFNDTDNYTFEWQIPCSLDYTGTYYIKSTVFCNFSTYYIPTDYSNWTTNFSVSGIDINITTRHSNKTSFVPDRYILYNNITGEKLGVYETKKNVLGWIYYWDSTSLKSFEDNADLIDMISPVWYHIDPECKILSYPGAGNQSFMNFSYQNGMKVIPLINNQDEDGEWNSSIIHTILDNPTLRNRCINNIHNLITQNNYPGINLDFENIFPEDRDKYTQFIKDISFKLHSSEKIVTVDVPAKSSDKQWDDWSAAYDYADISKYADYMIIMAYDEHWGSSDHAGPVASIDWVEDITGYAINTSQNRSKVVFALPLYARYWQVVNGSEGAIVNGAESAFLTYSEVMNLIKKYNATRQWNDVYKVPYFTYTDNRANYVVWYDDNESIEYKLGLMDEYGINSIALWHLGNEDSKSWEKIRSYKNSDPYVIHDLCFGSYDIEAYKNDRLVGRASNIFVNETQILVNLTEGSWNTMKGEI